MNSRPHPLRMLWPLLACAFLLGGCLTPTASTLHTLQPLRQQPLGSGFADFKEIVLLMPVQLAPHLQGRGLLNRQPTGASTASATHLWAGPLDQQIGQQIVAALKDFLTTDNVALYPGPRFAAIRYQLEVEMSEFSGNGGAFTTVAVWTLSDAVGKTILHRKTFRQDQPIDKPDYSGYVASASQAVADLSKEMAQALLAARRSQPEPPIRP